MSNKKYKVKTNNTAQVSAIRNLETQLNTNMQIS